MKGNTTTLPIRNTAMGTFSLDGPNSNVRGNYIYACPLGTETILKISLI